MFFILKRGKKILIFVMQANFEILKNNKKVYFSNSLIICT